MTSAYQDNARIFRAFCDENRLRILELLQEGDLCACVLVEKLGVKQSALSYHMKILVESGVVESTCIGKWTHYHISEQGSAYAQQLLRELTALHGRAETDCACTRA